VEKILWGRSDAELCSERKQQLGLEGVSPVMSEAGT
jgi:hypothetical protein